MNDNQLDIFEGNRLKTEGMIQSEVSANDQHEGWSEKAFDFLVGYAKKQSQFMAEDIRELAIKSKSVPQPPSNRAWGAIIIKAKKEGIIKHIAFGQVRNKKAHRANASIWQSIIYNPYE